MLQWCWSELLRLPSNIIGNGNIMRKADNQNYRYYLIPIRLRILEKFRKIESMMIFRSCKTRLLLWFKLYPFWRLLRWPYWYLQASLWCRHHCRNYNNFWIFNQHFSDHQYKYNDKHNYHNNNNNHYNNHNNNWGNTNWIMDLYKIIWTTRCPHLR